MNDIRTADAPVPVGPYPHARRAGGFLFLSGLGPRRPGTSEIPPDFAEQCHSTFANIRAVLEAGGARWEQLVDVTVFLTNLNSDFETFNRIYAEYFEDHQPTRTTVEVTALPTPIRVELKCIAWLGEED